MGPRKNGKKVKIGIVGVGRMGTYHANVLSTLNQEIEFLGIYDADDARSHFIAEKYNTYTFPSMDDLLGAVDGVCIAAPTRFHYEAAKRALMAGVHTLVEKPIANSIEEASELVAIARDRNLTFQVGHVERFKGAVVELRKIVENPYLVEARRLSPWIEKEWDTGVVLDLMIHDIDIVLSLIKSDVQAVDGVGKRVRSDYEDIAAAVVQFENGSIATITSSRLSETRTRTMSVSQDKAFIILDFESQDIDIYRGASASFFVSQREITYKQESFVERVKVQKENALKEELLHFIDCMLERTEPIVSGEDDIKTLDITLRIIEKINAKIEEPAKF
jgi:predicted dehydrogenase